MQHCAKVATPVWDVGPQQEGASSPRTSSSSANHLSISKVVDCEKASMQDTPHDEAKECFKKMKESVKSSACRHKAKGVQSAQAKLAERKHQHRAAEGRRKVPGWLAQQHTHGSHTHSKHSCTQG